MLWRKLRGVRELAIPPWNLLGLLVRKDCILSKNHIPFGSVSAVACSNIRSKAKPNLMECVPRLRKASSYPWKEFQWEKYVVSPPTPPNIGETPPPFTKAAPLPAKAPTDDRADADLI